jgi:uncharacterized protein
MGTTLSTIQARRVALRAQGLLGAPDRRAGVPGLLRRLGSVQLDTISVLARSQELVPFARLGPIGRDAVHDAYWSHEPGAAHTFEYWSHAACVLPVEEWPTFAFRRRSYRKRAGDWGSHVSRDTDEIIMRKLAAEGPLTTGELGGARKTPGWWDWSDMKIAVERLLSYGEVVCVERRGWRRVYDLPERALPEHVLHDDLDDDACRARQIALAGRALGVATQSDLLDYYRHKARPGFAELAERAGLLPVEVAGWQRGDKPIPAWIHPEALADLAAGTRGRHRTTLLSPFDSLIWDRARTERLFDFSHRLEAYVPKAKRQHGYFAMPLLHGGELVGRVDPAREGRTLIGRQVSFVGANPAAAVEPMARALAEAASWVGCDAVRVEAVTPPPVADALRAAVRAIGTVEALGASGAGGLSGVIEPIGAGE